MQPGRRYTDGTVTWQAVYDRAVNTSGLLDVNTDDLVSKEELNEAITNITHVQSADRALKDGNGNTITSTYVTNSQYNSNILKAEEIVESISDALDGKTTINIKGISTTANDLAEEVRSTATNKYIDFATNTDVFTNSIAHKLNILTEVGPGEDDLEDVKTAVTNADLNSNGVDCVYLCSSKYVVTLSQFTPTTEAVKVTYINQYNTYPGIVGKLSAPRRNFADHNKTILISGRQMLRPGYSTNHYGGGFKKVIFPDESYICCDPGTVSNEAGNASSTCLCQGQMKFYCPTGIKARLYIVIQNTTTNASYISLGTASDTSILFAEQYSEDPTNALLSNGNKIVYSGRTTEKLKVDCGYLTPGKINYLDFAHYCTSSSEVGLKLYYYEIDYTDADGNMIPEDKIITVGMHGAKVFVDGLVTNLALVTNSATTQYYVNMVGYNDNVMYVYYVPINPSTGLKGASNIRSVYLSAAHLVTLGTAWNNNAAETATVEYYTRFIPSVNDPSVFVRFYYTDTYALTYEGVYILKTSAVGQRPGWVNELNGNFTWIADNVDFGTRYSDPYRTAETTWVTPKNGATHSYLNFRRFYPLKISIMNGRIYLIGSNNAETNYGFYPMTFNGPMWERVQAVYGSAGAAGSNPLNTKLTRHQYREQGIYREGITTIADTVYTVSTGVESGTIDEFDAGDKQTTFSTSGEFSDQADSQVGNLGFGDCLSTTNVNGMHPKQYIWSNIVFKNGVPYFLLVNTSYIYSKIYNYGNYNSFKNKDYTCVVLTYESDWYDKLFKIVYMDPQTKYMVGSDLKLSDILNMDEGLL